MVSLLLALEVEPQRVLSYAEELEAQGHYLQAAREYIRYWVWFPSDSLSPYALMRAGLSYGKAGRPELAKGVFERYLRAGYPKPQFAELELAKALFALGEDYSGLLEKLRKTLPREAAKLEAWAHLVRDEPGKAKEILQRAGLDSLASALDSFPKGVSPWLASGASLLVPGAGQCLYGHLSDGAMALLFSVGMAVASAYYFKEEGRTVPGAATGALAAFFWGGQAYGAYVGARARRYHLRRRFLENLKPLLFPDRYTREFFLAP